MDRVHHLSCATVANPYHVSLADQFHQQLAHVITLTSHFPTSGPQILKSLGHCCRMSTLASPRQLKQCTSSDIFFFIFSRGDDVRPFAKRILYDNRPNEDE